MGRRCHGRHFGVGLLSHSKTLDLACTLAFYWQHARAVFAYGYIYCIHSSFLQLFFLADNASSGASLKLLAASLEFFPSLVECESIVRCVGGSHTTKKILG